MTRKWLWSVKPGECLSPPQEEGRVRVAIKRKPVQGFNPWIVFTITRGRTWTTTPPRRRCSYHVTTTRPGIQPRVTPLKIKQKKKYKSVTSTHDETSKKNSFYPPRLTLWLASERDFEVGFRAMLRLPMAALVLLLSWRAARGGWRRSVLMRGLEVGVLWTACVFITCFLCLFGWFYFL